VAVGQQGDQQAFDQAILAQDLGGKHLAQGDYGFTVFHRIESSREKRRAFQQRATAGKRLVDAKNGMSEPSWQAVRKRPALAMPADPACVFDSLLEAPLYCIDGRLD